MIRTAVNQWVGRASLCAIAALALFAFGAQPICAQVDTGSILGVVSDTSGAPIHGATVTLTNEGTNAALSTTTEADGSYKFSPVRIGSYKLSATYTGFQTTTQSGVSVNIGQNVVVNFSLKPGKVTETIEVTAAAPVLQSQDASVGQVVDSRNVNDLPLNGRNFTFLAQLAAGVNTPQADTRGNAASGAFAANGNRPAQNNYLLDGIDNNSDTVDFLNGTNYVVLPPVDAVQEFKVQTSDFSAEFGRSGAAVLNATIKGGTNEFHGDAWEFFRNDKLDAADFFENAHKIPKGALRQNQFGFTAGGPVYIPKVYDGRNKVFIFGDYQGLRRVQGTVLSGAVPSAAERTSNYTNFQDLITAQPCGNTNQPACLLDALGRTFPIGTVFDPATTRAVTAGQADPVTGLVAGNSGWVRDAFGCAAATVTVTLSSCPNLNMIPAGRLDPNAIKLLNLYPLPTNNASNALFSNFANSPKLFEHSNSFDTRLDINFNEKNQLFYRFSLVDDPQFIPGIFGGIADGGGFQQGTQTAIAEQSALGYTHTFSPTLINELRAGLNYLHTSRYSPEANNLTDIPAGFGIQGIPQQSLNGGLPAFGINGLQTLGSNAFLPSNEVTSTFQLTDDVTKIYGKHTFKMGIEWQHVKFSTLQPPWSRGEFDYNGQYTELPSTACPSTAPTQVCKSTDQGNTGRADFLLLPAASTVSGPDFVGGSSQIFASNISLTDNGKNYYGGYINDDWKLTPKLTVNLGLRYDFFGLVLEHHSAQANFVPAGTGPFKQATYLLPGGTDSCSNTFVAQSFINLLGTDNIACLATNAYGSGLGHSQNNNFAPRIGLAYQATSKLVVRAGFGIFYNGFENRGFSPNLGENYPFQFNFSYSSPNDVTPISGGTPFAGCSATAPYGSTATFEAGFACIPLSPLAVNPSGLGLRGIQFDYKTPYTMGGNLTLQYQITPTMSVQVGYVTTLARHLESFPNSNNPTSIAPTGTPEKTLVPFPDFGFGSSYAVTAGMSAYHALQTKVEKQFGHGLNFLATYTWSKTMSDAGDLLNGGSVSGYRAPSVPGLGMAFDYGLADFDIRNVVHFSGGYQLPFGKGKKYAGDATGLKNQIIGGWSTQWIAVLQDGQPISIGCPTGTASNLGCGALFTGQPLKLGLHTQNGQLSWFGNPGAFTQPAPCTLGGSASCLGGVTQVPGPGFHRFDLSFFKTFPITETRRFEFRTEVFNIFNHPNFNSPGFGGNGVVAISGSTNFANGNFGEIGSTRDAPYDPRQIQFALKFYW
ncbi:MAG TPA: TonB-dependent receptor [Candidatus Acidoferrum sp.]|nr:TonB-dependent receptor [Candidatus Acidoferrum sp.]